jgi:DNA topoisomerase-1
MYKKLSKSVEDNLNRAGRPKGVGNKSTGMAREAIAKFVDGNAPAMQGWLESVAMGIQATDKEGKPKFASLRNGQFLESLTMEDAMELFKLPREVAVFEEKPVVVNIGRFGPYIAHDKKFISLLYMLIWIIFFIIQI